MNRFKNVIVPVYAVILLTGAAGLIYQVAWQKYLGRLFGNDHAATAIILGTFLGGLSAGYYTFGKFSRRIQHHFKIYAFAEGLIGAWGLWFSTLFNEVEALTRLWTFSPIWLLILQGVCCSIIMIGVPVFCMGATIPLLTRPLSATISAATRVHALIYAVNTLGAFIGVLLAGFYLIPELGLPTTLRIAAFLNIGAGLFFYVLSFRFDPTPPADAAEKPVSACAASANPSFNYGLYMVALLSGFYVMALENVIIRIVNISFGSSSYSFSLTIAVFIVSIAIGSLVVAGKRQISLHTLFYNQLLLTLSLIALYPTLDVWPYSAHLIRIASQTNDVGFWVYHLHSFLALLAALIIPIGLSGATVPIVFHLYKRNLASVGDHSGFLFSLNTIGSLLGSLIGGFLLYTVFNNARVFLFAIVLAAVSAVAAAVYLSRIRLMAAIAVTVAVLLLVVSVPWYHESRFAVGTFRKREQLPFSLLGPKQFYREFLDEKQVRYYQDSPSGSVSVVGSPTSDKIFGESVSIYVNGKSDSNTVLDIDTLKLLAHLPALLAEKRERVMVIGLGTGSTVAELTLYPDIKQIAVAEISNAVIDALPHFQENHRLIAQSAAVSFQIGDAYRILSRSPHAWDLIISEPSNPWTTGVDALFTHEFYQRVKQHLSPTGILAQWAHIYEADQPMIDMIANTLRTNFKQVRTFLTRNNDLIFIASQAPISAAALARAEADIRDNPEINKSLAQLNLASIDAILIREIWSPLLVQSRITGVGIHIADHPTLHYMAGKYFFLNNHIHPKVLISSGTALFATDYLLAQRYTNWETYAFPDPLASQMINSLGQLFSRKNLPMQASLSYKQALYRKPHLKSNAERFRSELLPLILTVAAAEGRSIADSDNIHRIEFFLNFITDWIMPDPTGATSDFLHQGIAADPTPEDRNFCAVLASLSPFSPDPRQASELLSALERASDGTILAWPQDQGWFDLAIK